jgi:hypothetical protein
MFFGHYHSQTSLIEDERYAMVFDGLFAPSAN